MHHLSISNISYVDSQTTTFITLETYLCSINKVMSTFSNTSSSNRSFSSFLSFSFEMYVCKTCWIFFVEHDWGWLRFSYSPKWLNRLPLLVINITRNFSAYKESYREVARSKTPKWRSQTCLEIGTTRIKMWFTKAQC